MTSSSLEPGLLFKTRISESGLKHFQASLRVQVPRSEMIYGNRRNSRASTRPSQTLLKQIAKAAEKRIEKNKYCRTGFWLLDQGYLADSAYIRGECNEIANDADRRAFPDTLQQW